MRYCGRRARWRRRSVWRRYGSRRKDRRMRKIKAHCGIGYAGAEHEEEFEFEDDATEDEILEGVKDWAEQYLEFWWDE